MPNCWGPTLQPLKSCFHLLNCNKSLAITYLRKGDTIPGKPVWICVQQLSPPITTRRPQLLSPPYPSIVKIISLLMFEFPRFMLSLILSLKAPEVLEYYSLFNTGHRV